MIFEVECYTTKNELTDRTKHTMIVPFIVLDGAVKIYACHQISRSPVDSSTLQKSSDGLCCILCPVTSGTISVAGSVDSPHVRTQELTNDLSISRQSPHYMEIYRLPGSAA